MIFIGFHAFRYRQQGLAAQTYLTVRLDFDDLDVDDIANLQDLCYGGNTTVVELRDVQQAFLLGTQFDEGTKTFADFLDLALEDRTDVDRLCDLANACDGRIGTRLIHGSDRHGTVVFDVDLGARLLDDAADHFATRADHGADHLDGDHDGGELRSILRQFGIRLCHVLVHDAQDVQTSLTCLLQCRAHDVDGQTFDLDVHLAGRDAFTRTCHLEVHVAKEVLVTKDVAQHGHTVAFKDQTHGDTGNGLLHGYAGVEECQRTGADGGHR